MDSASDAPDQVYKYVAVILALILLIVLVLQHLNQQTQQKSKVVKKLLKNQLKKEQLEKEEREKLEQEQRRHAELERMLEKLGPEANRAESEDGRSVNSGKLRRASAQMSQTSQSRMQDTFHDHTKAISKSKHQITRICLTGGPCAGKTTALSAIQEKLVTQGFKVLMVPEAATLMMKGGCFIQTGKMTFADGVKF